MNSDKNGRPMCGAQDPDSGWYCSRSPHKRERQRDLHLATGGHDLDGDVLAVWIAPPPAPKPKSLWKAP